MAALAAEYLGIPSRPDLQTNGPGAIISYGLFSYKTNSILKLLIHTKSCNICISSELHCPSERLRPFFSTSGISLNVSRKMKY